MKKCIIGTAVLAAGLIASGATGYVDGKSTVPGVYYAADPGRLIPHRTEFSFSDDGKALTISFDVDYPMELLDRSKGVWMTGDCLEIWLDPSGEGKQVMQFAIDPFGRRWDRRRKDSENPGFTWTSKVTRSEKGWKAEVRFPYSDFEVKPPAKGERWMINVCRTFVNETRVRTFASWANVGANFNNPGKFAELLFGSPEEVAAVKKRRRVEETSALRTEAAKKGYADRFAFKFKRIDEGASDVLLREIADEMRFLDAVKAVR